MTAVTVRRRGPAARRGVRPDGRTIPTSRGGDRRVAPATTAKLSAVGAIPTGRGGDRRVAPAAGRDRIARDRRGRRRRAGICAAGGLLIAALVAGTAGAAGTAAAQDRPAHGLLFPPEDLGLLEGPDRDAWQEPDRIMDALGIADGAVVADVGAGGGWFTVRLARRVGPRGTIYAEDVQRQMIESITRRIRREGLTNVQTIIGTAHNPMIPGPVDAVLMVEVYSQLDDPVALLRNVRPRLKPGGRVGIVEYRLDGGGPGPPLAERVEPDRVIDDAAEAGLRLLAREDGFRYQYLLVFAASPAPAP